MQTRLMGTAVVLGLAMSVAPAEVEEPRMEDKLKGDRKRGWGLKIIRGLVDDLRILSGARGTTVIMRKSR